MSEPQRLIPCHPRELRCLVCLAQSPPGHVHVQPVGIVCSSHSLWDVIRTDLDVTVRDARERES